MYDSPTGKIIGACYLGKENMCNELLKSNNSFFSEGSAKVDPIVSSLLYAADRRYNLPVIEKAISDNDIVVLDRYTYSNMAHQGGKIENESERTFMFQILEHLEFNVCKLPRADMVIFLHMPYENIIKLKDNSDRIKSVDDNEKIIYHLRDAEKTYLQLSEYYNFETIECIKDGNIKNKEDILDEIYSKVKKIVE